MSVFLLILKIIGIVILSLLALVLFLVILLLAVPFRYRGRFEKEEGVAAYAAVSWLFRIVDFKVSYGEGGLSPELRVFWLFRKTDFRGKKPAEKKEKEKKEKPAEPEEEKKTLKERFEEAKTKAKKVFRLIDNDRVKNALSVLFDRLKKILKSVLPKKISGNAVFGLNGPYDTARALSVMSVLMPLHKNAVEITPDFERNVLEAEVSFRGRVILGALAFYALTLILHKDVIYTIRKTKKYFGKPKEVAHHG